MNKRTMRGLLMLNVALLACLVMVTASSRVTAQQPVGRAPGDYTMIAGEVLGQTASAIYIVDATNQELVAVFWDQSRRKLQPIGYRDLAADAKQAGRNGR